MKKVILFLLIMLFLPGCSKKVVFDSEVSNSFILDEYTYHAEDTEKNKNTKNNILKIPTKEQVLAKRAEVSSIMTEKELLKMISVIKTCNLKFEHEIMWNNLFAELSDPKNLTWNLLSQIGEVHTGWAYSAEAEEIRKTSDLTDVEFYELYGEKVITYNDYTAIDFINALEELKSYTNSEALKKDLTMLQGLMEKAEITHDVVCIEEISQILHDMDYYLLRYGPEDVGKYTADSSMVSKYYGVLNVYKNSK